MKDVVVINSAELDTPPEGAKENEVNGALGEWGVAEDSGAPGVDSSLEVAAGSKQTEVRKKKKKRKKKGWMPRRVVAGASWAEFFRDPPPGAEQEHKASMKSPVIGEDDESDSPRIDSRMDKALSYAHGRIEVTDATTAIIIGRQDRGRKVLTYRAIIGEAREIDLVPPTHAKKTNEERELHRLIVGDMVQVREKVQHSFAGAESSWVMIKRTRDCLDSDRPQMIARLQGCEPEQGVATVQGLSRPVHVCLKQSTNQEDGGEFLTTSKGGVEFSVGRYFLFQPFFSESGDLLPIQWEDATAYEKGMEGEEKERTLVTGDDLAMNFHYAGRAVLDFVQEKFGVLGDLTVSENLSGMPLSGGKTFMEGLSAGGDDFKWGEMVMAAVYAKVLQDRANDGELVADQAEGQEADSWQGKEIRQMSEEEKIQCNLARERFQEEETLIEGKVLDFCQREVKGGAFFFDPTPEHLPAFLKWLGEQMREGNRQAIRRRAIVAVDVMAGTTPVNMRNVQVLSLLTDGHYWKPRTLTLLGDRILHTVFDASTMCLMPVSARRGYRTLLLEYDSLFVGSMRPMPTWAKIGHPHPGVYMGTSLEDLTPESELDLGEESVSFTVTVPRTHMVRQAMSHYRTARLPTAHPDQSYEKWVVRFPNEEIAEVWLQENRYGVSEQLFTSPVREYIGGPHVMNLQTKGYVEPKDLYYILQADWVELVGRSGGSYEYRFSTLALMKDLGLHLYNLNRMYTVGKRKKGKLLNTYTLLKTDEGHLMYVKAADKPPHSRPFIDRIRYMSTGSDLPRESKVGVWFSFSMEQVTKSDLEMVCRDFGITPTRQGVIMDESGLTLWAYLTKEEEVNKMRAKVLRVSVGGIPVIVRCRGKPPGNLEPLQLPMTSRPDGTGCIQRAEVEPEKRAHSKLTVKLVKQFQKTAGFRKQQGIGPRTASSMNVRRRLNHMVHARIVAAGDGDDTQHGEEEKKGTRNGGGDVTVPDGNGTESKRPVEPEHPSGGNGPSPTFIHGADVAGDMGDDEGDGGGLRPGGGRDLDRDRDGDRDYGREGDGAIRAQSRHGGGGDTGRGGHGGGGDRGRRDEKGSHSRGDRGSRGGRGEGAQAAGDATPASTVATPVVTQNRYQSLENTEKHEVSDVPGPDTSASVESPVSENLREEEGRSGEDHDGGPVATPDATHDSETEGDEETPDLDTGVPTVAGLDPDLESQGLNSTLSGTESGVTPGSHGPNHTVMQGNPSPEHPQALSPLAPTRIHSVRSREAGSGKNPVENIVEPGISPAPGSGRVPTFAVPKMVKRLPSKSAGVPPKGVGRARSSDRSTKKLPKTSSEMSPRSKDPVAHRTRTKQTQGTLHGYVTSSSSDGSRETSPAPVQRKVTAAKVSPPNTRTGDKATRRNTERTSKNKTSKKLKKSVTSKRSPIGAGARGGNRGGRGGNRGGRDRGGHRPVDKSYTRKVSGRPGASS